MLVLSTLHKLLSQALSPDLAIAALLTPSGQLVACAYSHGRTKDDVRIVVGLAGEVWAEVHDIAAAESELGRIAVVPIQDTATVNGTMALSQAGGETEQPLMLVVLCATDAVEWDDLEVKAKEVAKHLTMPIGKIRAPLSAPGGSTTPPLIPRAR